MMKTCLAIIFLAFTTSLFASDDDSDIIKKCNPEIKVTTILIDHTEANELDAKKLKNLLMNEGYKVHIFDNQHPLGKALVNRFYFTEHACNEIGNILINYSIVYPNDGFNSIGYKAGTEFHLSYSVIISLRKP